MSKSLKSTIAALLLTGALSIATTGQAMAYSCSAQFEHANVLISEAEQFVKKDTDSRILAMIAEAKGIAQAGIISHNAASQGHTGEVGKFMHSDAVRKGKWAQQLAKQAIFLLTGEVE